jgi:WD40 repeat protein
VHSTIATSATFLDDQTVASVGFGGNLCIWSVASAHATHEILARRVSENFFAMDDHILWAHRSDPASIVKVDLMKGSTEVLPLNTADHVIAVSPEGRIATAGSDGIVRIADLARADKFSQLPIGHSSLIKQVALSSDRDRIASLSLDGEVKVWSASGKLLQAIAFRPPAIQGAYTGPLVFSQDGQRLASADGENRVILHDLPTGRSSHLTRHTKTVLALAFSADGTKLASSDWGGDVYVSDLTAEESVKNDPYLFEHLIWVRALCFTPDGKSLVVSGGDDTLRFWDLKSRQQVCSISHPVFSRMQFSPKGDFLAGVALERIEGVDDGPAIIVLRAR